MSNEPTKLTEQTFDDVVGRSAVPVVIDFWAEWCPPCRALNPTIERLAQSVEGRAVVAKVDVDTESALAERFGVQSIPTVLVIHHGEVVHRVAGIQTLEALESLVDQVATAA